MLLASIIEQEYRAVRNHCYLLIYDGLTFLRNRKILSSNYSFTGEPIAAVRRNQDPSPDRCLARGSD